MKNPNRKNEEQGCTLYFGIKIVIVNWQESKKKFD